MKLLLPFLGGIWWCLILACVADEISYFVEIRVLFVIQYGTATVQFRLWGRHCRSCEKNKNLFCSDNSLSHPSKFPNSVVSNEK